jgi:hypothetical protein
VTSGDESERRCRLYGLSASFGVVCKCDPCVCYLSICDYYSALENETLYFEHLFQYYNNRVIISSENKPLNFIKGSDMQ